MSAKTDRDVIQKAWEEYHGPVIDEGGEEYIPVMPPAFMRGFVDGYEYGAQRASDLKSAPKPDQNEKCEKCGGLRSVCHCCVGVSFVPNESMSRREATHEAK